MDTKRFEEIITLQRGFDLPESKRKNGNIPLVSSNGITAYIDTFKCVGPGVITGRSGTIGKVFYVSKSYWPLNTTLYIKDFHGNNPKYISYWLSQFNLVNYANGASVPTLNRNELTGLICKVHNSKEQQHIVNTIGSIDDLIENHNKIIENLNKLGLIKINRLNKEKKLIDLSTIAKLEKGNELGSLNYKDYFSDNFINYIRVGDLLSLSNTYVDKDLCNKFADENDILIAMDGAPGRNAIGLKGTYSSGLYKVLCSEKEKGLVYYSLNSDLNQSIIRDMSQGTTILHASKSIPFLKTINLTEEDKEYFNNIFKEIVLLKKKVSLLKCIKDRLLIKYFTNQ